MKKRFTVEEHIEFAVTIRRLYSDSANSFVEFASKFPKSHPITKKYRQLLDLLQDMKSELDAEYHRVADDETFAQYGHIYYANRIERDPPVKVRISPAASRDR